jgi:hypothetical protein
MGCCFGSNTVKQKTIGLSFGRHLNTRFYIEMVFTDQIGGPSSKSKASADEIGFSSKSYKDIEADIFGWGSVSLPGDLPFSLLP